jgi:predicted NAD-dependent protein-ADP-ribosyltransferase YbiA (DUF1768 family)
MIGENFENQQSKIESFSGKYRFLSNYWPVDVEFEGISYPSVEQAYKAAKTLDIDSRMAIANLTPNKKDLGEKIELILEASSIRPDWNDELRLQIMELLLNQKFDGRDPVLKQKLIDTGNLELIEGNTWGDVFFGVCNGIGENHLGKLLMKIRGSI